MEASSIGKGIIHIGTLNHSDKCNGLGNEITNLKHFDINPE